MQKIAIFIPTYNAAKTLPILLDRIPEQIKKEVQEIFVVDDASQDNTHLIGIGYKTTTGLSNLKVYKNEKNKGYGGNQKYAYQYSIDNNFDLVVMLHGDAQYAPEKIPALLEPFEEDPETALVFGSRMKGDPLKGGMPIYKFLGNKLLTFIENKVLNMDLSEYHSGFRVYNLHKLKSIPFHLCSDGYLFDTDILIQFKIKNLQIKEVPIPTYYGDEKSHVNIFEYGLNILKSLFEYYLNKKSIKKVPKFDFK
ncbi:MAG TPA: glycosyltransferase family 2 protein [Candidatus Nanoarchaeia archaeon]|nr:glycosyltransferase family 2 protein [Candidatus Nanoarchaeia archaeon]